MNINVLDWHGMFLFGRPWLLVLLILIPVLGLWFLVMQKNYWRDAFEFSQVSVIKKLKHQRHAIWLQRLLPGLILLGLFFGIVGLAQPTIVTQVATENRYLMLVLDISISMEATDLKPNRLEAEKNAAIDFVKSLPQDVKIGLEYFAGNSYLISPPIQDHNKVRGLLNSLVLEDLRPGTALGDAILVGIEGLHNSMEQINSEQTEQPDHGSQLDQGDGTVILITDGESNLGVSPYVAIEEALKHKIRVFTVGVGEQSGAYVRGGIFTHLDEETLQTIAQRTGGEYFRARSFHDFEDIYDKIAEKTLRYEEKPVDLTVFCLALCTMMCLAAFYWGTAGRRF